ncbi:hypothetical protein MHM582_0665 [Microbacterium sp. HM58-2]|nr:hypothetical protein MHM582_0665 [Microbacterium sp. HM58-2]
MTSFAHLFPSGPRTQEESGVFDDHHTVRRLREMIGDPRDEIDMASPRSGARLAQLVAEAKADPSPALAWEPAATGKRPRRRMDVLSAAAASLAIAALAVAGIVAGVQTANADPAGDAMQSLRADEESIRSAESALTATHERLRTGLETGAADAATLRAAVDAAREAPAPWLGWNATADVLDPALADEILAEIDRHTAALQSVVLADLPAPYEQRDLDADSLEEVGSAIGAAQEHLDVLDATTEALRETRADVDSIDTAHAGALEALSARFAESGAALVEKYENADIELQEAVTAAAAAVVTSKLQGEAGTAAVTAYRDAVVALMADEPVEEERPRTSNPGTGTETTEPGTADPGTTDPGTTDPGATPPPEPTDPIVIPPVEGGTEP